MSDYAPSRPDSIPWFAFAGGLVLIYLLPFAAVIVDEFVLKTFYFCSLLPNEAGPIFHMVYYPLLKLMGL
ncbi:MAG: hypothetical protein KDA96_11775 [Planctomycetaceae bacterium]|nr:hypothetical protein [Planctomycetaceae bacterium]MCA9079286.1 hypothetical protein [Planctomycetaceae bacterium]